MHPATRSQTSNDGLEAALASALVCPPEEDITRQELADESSITNILTRFGAIPRYNVQPIYGLDIDTDLDLMRMHEDLDRARDLYATLPQRVHALYPDFPAFMSAMANGDLSLNPKPTPTPPEPESASGAPPEAS